MTPGRHLGNLGDSSSDCHHAAWILLGLEQDTNYVPQLVFEYLAVMFGEGMEPLWAGGTAVGGKSLGVRLGRLQPGLPANPSPRCPVCHGCLTSYCQLPPPNPKRFQLP